MPQANQIYIWHGENDYDVIKNVNAWKEKFCQNNSKSNITSIDLEEPSLKKDELILDLKNAFNSNSLFGPKKLIILKNFLLTDPKKISPAIKSKLKEIESLTLDLVLSIPENFFVIFWQTQNPDKRKNLYKKTIDKAQIQEYTIPKGYQLSGWILRELKYNQAQATNAAVQKLVILVGNDLWLLGQEIKKLSAYKNGQVIEEKDVDLLVKAKFYDKIFNLMDAISLKDKNLAVRYFYDQLSFGSNEIFLLTMIVKQFKTLIKVKSYVFEKGNYNPNPNIVAKEFKIHPFVAQKALAQEKRFTMPELLNIYKELLAIDLKIKTTGTKFPLLFDMFISRI